ncbi:MAG TPA: hypothetical protein VIQ48_06750 [Rhodanobacter sp.]
MSQVLAGVALVGFATAWFAAVLAWFASIVFGFKAIRRTRSGVKRGTMWNPANALLNSNLLTEDGLRYRRKCFLSVGVFIACVVVPLLVAAVTGQLK